MTIMNKAVIGLAIAAAAATAQAATIYSADFSGLGAMESPGSLTTTFSAGAGAATLSFEIAGYASLDAVNCCTDTFHVIVNGTEIFTGSFNMGGGGTNTIFFNPNGGTALTTTFGASGDPHNSTDVTWAGGITDISVGIDLLAGTNTLTFAYESNFPQGTWDEAWGVNGVNVTAAVPEPETYALMLAGLGVVGWLGRRRRV